MLPEGAGSDYLVVVPEQDCYPPVPGDPEEVLGELCLEHGEWVEGFPARSFKVVVW